MPARATHGPRLASRGRNATVRARTERVSRHADDLTNEIKPGGHCDPAALAESIDVEPYDVVFVGYPLWWETAPRVVRTFLESADWAGKTIVTFATSGSSTRGADGVQLHDSAPDARWGAGPSHRRLRKRDQARPVGRRSESVVNRISRAR
ncbi:flavodoxin [Bifidobacterium goeldii]|uniref:Flavodoxin n=1 Tax=Bifidobacterium goeldii TaxID=2306975 RepID=A0A430FLT4_9BIFI|nr:flavodoxin [Bifidobacterium goeldii]RSX53826.1 flavodoxin [Bifidobacterium goeldii]